jgi:DNA-directed RNA polymerase specialized sigma24 family protein
MDAPSEALAPVSAVSRSSSDLEAVFHAHYTWMARVIARVIRDPARAEELAVDVLLKWSRTRPGAMFESAPGWLHRAAVRAALDELRRRTRRARHKRLVAWVRGGPTPEDLLATSEDAARVRGVLATMSRR